jgi:signal transduction histidine kinase
MPAFVPSSFDCHRRAIRERPPSNAARHACRLASFEKYLLPIEGPMRGWREWPKRLGNPRGAAIDKGWAGRSLEGAISEQLLRFLASMHAVVAVAALTTLGINVSGLLAASLPVTGIVAALLVRRFGVGHGAFLVHAWAIFLLAWVLSPALDSTLLFAGCWLCNLTSLAPAFLLRGRSAWLLPVTASLTLPLLMLATRPELAGHPLIAGVLITQPAITAATRIGLSYLIDYTDSVDAEARALEERTAALTVRKAATHQAAEDARILHDTAINTLGAIASGGAAIADHEAVRSRCLADVEAIDDLRAARGEDPGARTGLREAIRAVGIRVRHDGLSDDDLARTESLLPAPVLRALGRAAAEAVQNAARHSGTDEVRVTIGRDDHGVRLTIRDEGVGMQVDLPRARGLVRSILERADEAGIQATIDSAPGAGTTVRLDYRFDAPASTAGPLAEPPGASASVEDLVRALRVQAVFALSAGLVGVGVVLAALNHPGQPTPEWLMVLVVAAACGLAWRERQRSRISWPTALALIVGGPLAFALSAWAVGFGRVDPILWQAIAPTGPLLALLIVPLPRAAKRLGYAAYALTVAVIAAWIAPASAAAMQITLVAGLIGLGLTSAVRRFIHRLASVATAAHQAQRQAFAVSLELAAVEAAGESRRRWRDAGLDDSIRLLRAIGNGQLSPQEPSVRQRCADEEAFLRQLSLLHPELIQMGTWLARALHASRQRGVGLTVRAGATDAPAADARHLGETLLTVVDALPAGTPLTTALFASARGLTMTLVAPTPHLRSCLDAVAQRVQGCTQRTLGTQDLVELTAVGSTA